MGGGRFDVTVIDCDCPQGSDACTITDFCPTGPDPTAEVGCTRETIELSYCRGIGLPDPCLSVGVCA